MSRESRISPTPPGNPDEKRAHLIDLRREHLIDKVCIQEILPPERPDAFAQRFLAAFHQGLKQARYVEGQNVAVEYRWAGNDYERLTALCSPAPTR